MPYEIDQETKLVFEKDNKRVEQKCTPSSAHRSTSYPKKTKWLISINNEVECFSQAFTEEWTNGTEAWGLREETGNLLQLGIGPSPNLNVLKLAKFVDKTKKGTWHGYPADYIAKKQDIPKDFILKKWRASQLISKHQFTKIRQGKSCNL